MAFGTAADDRFAYLIHLHRALHARLHAKLFERALHCQCVHYRRQHAHVVGLRAVHSLRRAGHAAKDVAAPDDQADFEPGFLGRLHFLGQFHDECGIDAELLVAHQHLARELQEDTFHRR